MMNETIHTILNRRSIRKYTKQSIPEEILIRHQLVQKKCVDEKHIYRDMLIKRNNLDVYKNQMSKWFLNEIEKSIKHILS